MHHSHGVLPYNDPGKSDITCLQISTYAKYAQGRHRTISNSTEKSSDLAEGAAKSAAIDPELGELLGRVEKPAACYQVGRARDCASASGGQPVMPRPPGYERNSLKTISSRCRRYLQRQQ